MFVFIVNYIKDLAEVDKHVVEHRAFLDQHYKLGNFIVSGRQNPPQGGVILCNVKTREEALEISNNDPFTIQGVAKYTIIEFNATKHAQEFQPFLK